VSKGLGLPPIRVAIQSRAVRFFLLSWLFVAVLVGYSGILRTTRLPMPALGVAISVALVALVAISRHYRERALRAGVRPLIAVHLTRFGGIYVLMLANRGLIPNDFALAAGWGHIVVAVLAAILLLAVRPETPTGRNAILAWNVIGVLSVLLIFAAAMRMVRPDQVLQGGFTSLPLSLLPTFLAPLIVVTHVLIFIWWAKGRS
jgi:hypothetical protein